MSTVEAKLDHLRRDLTVQLASFKYRRKDNKWKAFAVRIGIIASGSATTVLLGLNFPGHEQIAKNAALILSAIATLLAACESHFNHRELWIRYTVTTNNLKSILSDLEYLALSENMKERDLDAIFRRYQAELSETNKEWQTMRSRLDNANKNNRQGGLLKHDVLQ